MSQQGKWFFESIYDAMGAAIQAAGGYKRVSGLLWPSLKPSTAEFRLRHCLDENKAEKLAMCEMVAILRVAQEKGDNSVLDYLAQEFNFRLTPIEPKDEAAELQREIRDGIDAINSRMARLERVQSKIKAVS